MDDHLDPLPRLHAVAGGAFVGVAIATLPTVMTTMLLTVAGAAVGETFMPPELNETFVVGSALAGALLGVPVVATVERVLARLTSRVSA